MTNPRDPCPGCEDYDEETDDCKQSAHAPPCPPYAYYQSLKRKEKSK